MKKIVDIHDFKEEFQDVFEHDGQSRFVVEEIIHYLVNSCSDYVEPTPLVKQVKSHKKGSALHGDWFNLFHQRFFVFKNTRKLPISWTVLETIAMNKIIIQLLAKTGSDYGKALDGWVLILTNWDVLNDFIKDQTQLTAINKHLEEIITKIKRHAKQSTDKGLGKWA